MARKKTPAKGEHTITEWEEGHQPPSAQPPQIPQSAPISAPKAAKAPATAHQPSMHAPTSISSQAAVHAQQAATRASPSSPASSKPAAPALVQPPNIDHLVSLTFDSDPNVRKKTAEELGNIDDPRAIFALVELSSDREPAVQETARIALEGFKRQQKDEQEAIVSLEQLFAARKEQKQTNPEESIAAKQRMMPTLEKLFLHLDPKKAQSVRDKLMPSIERLFSGGKGLRKDPLSTLENLHNEISVQEHQAAKAVQPVQKQAGPDELNHDEIRQIRTPQTPTPKIAEQPTQRAQEKEEEVPKPQIGVEIEDMEMQPKLRSRAEEMQEETDSRMEEAQEALLQKDNDIYSQQPDYFNLAYQLARTPGIKKSELSREQKRLIANAKKEIELAFKTAASRVEEEGLSSLSNLKPGMKHLSFSPMQITAMSDTQLGKKGSFAKIIITDGKKSVPLLLAKERTGGIMPNESIMLKDVGVDFLVESSELVLVAGEKSKVLVSK